MRFSINKNAVNGFFKSKPVQIVIAIIILLASAIIGFLYPLKQKSHEDFASIVSYKRELKEAEHVQFQVYERKLAKHNLKLLDTNHFEFNSSGSPLLTVANDTKAPCYLGNVDGCWGTEVDAMSGDKVAIQIGYSNHTDVPIENVSAGLKISRCDPPFRGLYVTAYVLVKNKAVKKGMGAIYLEGSPDLVLDLLPKDSEWRKSTDISKPIGINSDDLFLPRTFLIGTVPPHQSGTLIARFKIRKAKE